MNMGDTVFIVWVLFSSSKQLFLKKNSESSTQVAFYFFRRWEKIQGLRAKYTSGEKEWLLLIGCMKEFYWKIFL